ncbi:hypothetical protein Pint_30187 [Pistacia integerrima]|uniref:Uncharacterized protein n=1 Tax=Pistacia integerrima TaxID=434235 RepID=A0ACC0X0X3_9ROSI|nr:hypothetical protein Pint_30187 [Pistacia integerrima]
MLLFHVSTVSMMIK